VRYQGRREPLVDHELVDVHPLDDTALRAHVHPLGLVLVVDEDPQELVEGGLHDRDPLEGHDRAALDVAAQDLDPALVLDALPRRGLGLLGAGRLEGDQE
jgi:hypothetical protein